MARVTSQRTVTVDAAGTAQQFATTSDSVVSLALQAITTNAGAILIGDSALDSSTNRGIVLEPGDTWDADIEAGDPWLLTDMYVDADTNDDGIVYIARIL